MDFDEFLDCCSVDFCEMDNNKTQVLVIFSSGMRKEYSSNFVKANESVAKTLVAGDLYNYIKEQFNG